MIGICFMEPDANTSSVTATMSSPTVVLIILRGRIMSPRYAAISVARRRPADDGDLKHPA